MKPLKRSVSLVIRNPGGRSILLVRRPDDDESLPGAWGLPATSLKPGETEHGALRRTGREKLGVAVRPLGTIGETHADRPAHRLEMRDFEAEIESGEPAVPQPFEGTQYTDWRWGDAADLIPAARAGSLCSRVLLDELGIDWH